MCCLTPRGIEGKPVEDRVSFPDADAVVVSSMPIHHHAGWPPSSPLDAVSGALRSGDWRDALVAVWERPSPVR